MTNHWFPSKRFVVLRKGSKFIILLESFITWKYNTKAMRIMFLAPLRIFRRKRKCDWAWVCCQRDISKWSIFKYIMPRSGKGESKTIFKIRIFIASQSDLMLSFHIPGALGQMFAQFRSHQHKELNSPKKEFFPNKIFWRLRPSDVNACGNEMILELEVASKNTLRALEM